MKYSNLEHAKHNECACDYLFKERGFEDWVITTAFYSALHYCRHKLFPMEVAINDKKETARNFEDYCRLNNIFKNKHSILRRLIEDLLPVYIAATYNQLMDTCFTARYVKYKHSIKVARLAQKRLNAIKLYCVKL